MYSYDNNGQKIQAQQKVPSQIRENYGSDDSSKKKKMWLWIGLVVLVVIILAVLSYWMYSKKSSSSGSMGFGKIHKWGFRFY